MQETDELFTAISLVRAGLGVSLVPRSAALMRLPGVRFRELTLPEAAWNIAMAWHRDSDRRARWSGDSSRWGWGDGRRSEAEDEGLRTRDPGRRTNGRATLRPRHRRATMPPTVGERHLRIIAVRAGGMACRAAAMPRRRPRRRRCPSLTTIKQIRALSQDEGARGYPVRVRGIVTHFDEQHDVTLMVHDGEFGQFVATPKVPGSVGTWHGLRRGDVVQIDGRTVRGGFAPNILPTSIRKLGQEALPTPKRIPFASMLSGRHDCDYVEVIGVIQRAWAVLRSRAHVCLPKSPSKTASCARRSGITPDRTCTA